MSSVLLENAVITWLLLGKSDLYTLVQTNIWKHNLRAISGIPLNESGKCAIVVVMNGGDSPGINSLAFPRVNFKIYADHSRNSSSDITKYDSVDKMWAIFRVLNKYLHIVNCEPVNMDGVNVLNSFRGVEPVVLPDDDAKMNFLWVGYDMKIVY